VPEIEPGSVRFATICDDEHGFTRSFLLSFLPMLAVDLGGERRIWRGGYSIQGATSSGVVEGRNEVVREFLSSKAEWLFFIDADMGFEPDTLERLMDVADPVERPIVGGLCFGFGPIADHLGAGNSLIKRPFPTIFDLRETEDDVGFQPRWGYMPGVVQRCTATGAALLLIHRSVLTAMRDKWGEVWFDRMRHPKAKKLWGEDTSFSMRAGLLGVPVFVHAGVQTSHSKVIMVTQDVFMSELVAPAATDEVAVIVPVMKRPENAAPFMASLKASTGLATVYAIAHSEDEETIKAWDAAGAIVHAIDEHPFAPKVNHGYSVSDEPWLFIVGDDVRFHPGWLDHAQHIANLHNVDVIATNDLGNPAVLAGEHATHPLIRRTYIDEQGASWDGPGVVCHEGYRHWYVDNEWTTVAKQRGTFAPALASIVEHLHPLWGKAENDPIYKKGQAHADQDRRLFARRLRDNTKVAS
jgi:glycosyltransferase involved in cell wall biosynthesis